VSAELFTVPNVEKKCTCEFGEATGKLGLKMTNRTHTNEKKMVQLYYFVSGCVISMLLFLFINRSRLYGQVSKQESSPTALWLLKRGGATTHDFLGAQRKI